MTSTDLYDELDALATQMMDLKPKLHAAFNAWKDAGFATTNAQTGAFCQMLAERVYPAFAFSVLLRVSPDEAITMLSRYYVGTSEYNPLRSFGSLHTTLSMQITEILDMHGDEWLAQQVLDGRLELDQLRAPHNAQAFAEAFDLNDLDWPAWLERVSREHAARSPSP